MRKTILLLLFAVTSLVMHADDNGSLFVYLADGTVEPYLRAEIDSIRIANGNHQICTSDSIFTHKLEDIVKVSFVAPPTVARPGTINLAVDELGKYIKGCYTDEWGDLYLLMNESVPQDVIPERGTYLYQIEPSPSFPAGFLGEVGYVDDKEIYVYDCKLTDVFESLAWTGDSAFETVDGEILAEGDEEYDDEVDSPEYAKSNTTRKANGTETTSIPWLVAYNRYPNLISGVYTLSDELKDILVGAEQGRIDSKIRIKPIIGAALGAYVLGGKRGADGEWEVLPTEIYKFHTFVDVKVEAEATGRASLNASKTLGQNKSVKYTLPLGLGQNCSVVFNGTLKLEGTMGVDYKYSAAYIGTSTSSIMICPDENLSAGWAYGQYKVQSVPIHTLDASMDGKLALNASLTISVQSIANSLSAMTATYALGSGLSGSALYKTSQLEEAQTNNALYERITNEGITATPVEMISHSFKYGTPTIKIKPIISPTKKETFYAVPPFESVTHDGSSLTFTIKSGQQMEGRRSSLGFKVKSQSGDFTTYPSSAVWSGASCLTGEPVFDVNNDIVYPTATLCGKTILCSPTYPVQSIILSPVITYQSGPECIMRGGLPIMGSYTNGGTYYLVGYPQVSKSSNNGK